MKYAPEDLKRLHEVQVEILSEVIRVCKENEITYFAVYGTALGAIRHDGFIPWDDDIDLGMLRDDYERFLQIAPKQLKNGYVLQHFSVEPNAPAYFAKVRKNGTLFVEENFQHIKMHHGIFVDIIPFDRVPEDENERKKYNAYARLLNILYVSKSVWTTAKHVIPVWYKRYLVNFCRILFHIILIPVQKKFLFDKLDQALRKCNNSNTCMISDRGGITPACRIEDYLPVIKQPFETTEIAVPNNYDKILRANYGDYMKLPAESSRISHAPISLSFDD